MKNYNLYDAVRSLPTIDAIEEIETACRFAKMEILRKGIEDAIAAASAAGFSVTIDHENEDGVKEVTIAAGTSTDDWGVMVR